MQPPLATLDVSRPTDQFRITAPYFDATLPADLIPVHGPFATRRPIVRGKGQLQHLIDFVRSSYLSLDNHAAIVAGAIAAIQAQPSLNSSRAGTQQNCDLLGELEETLSEMFRARVLAFSSLMLVDMVAMPMLSSGRLTGGRKPVVVFDSFARISFTCQKLMVGNRSSTAIVHNDIGALERLCRQNPVVAYVCDGVYWMGDYSLMDELRRLQECYGLFLYIDDTHGLSTFGSMGEGFARSQFPQVLGDRTIITGSLANGFGASGGILMLGTADHEALFRSHYSIPDVCSEAPNLAAVGAALGSCRIHRSAELRQRQGQLAQRIDLFDRRVATAGQGNSLPIRMITVGSEVNAVAIARGLLDCGFYTLVTFFPTIGQGTAAIRVCITADHEPHDIERLCECILQQVVERTGKPYPLR
ncbi:aminotransferase class I/II-fold pyridoxal phosphate-dependent enzyme [Bradyrhizobium sp. SSUT77]|uniref:aminotransferase class I/II-fold pyridoxal phosphate-dependent enzyme n=1 Tax=Bradyrhizobium sp. SSUT77 TaxID=3040603 RepID=UPI002448B0A5|nr:aminotransferase class I/II-fold pyridoxal phosphate-dependent enzyme [Bradyrhizobium sp. SSUT77]MDH2348949.1 aminotransferase class I/II-fold pyridoxal phosphate-dependent enzyme [Bradyrhizobium sp. SSUT77]